MSDGMTIQHAIYAIGAVREQFNRRLDEIEAILSKELPNPPMPRKLPATVQGRKKYYRENGVVNECRSRRLPRKKSKALETKQG